MQCGPVAKARSHAHWATLPAARRASSSPGTPPRPALRLRPRVLSRPPPVARPRRVGRSPWPGRQGRAAAGCAAARRPASLAPGARQPTRAAVGQAHSCLQSSQRRRVGAFAGHAGRGAQPDLGAPCSCHGGTEHPSRPAPISSRCVPSFSPAATPQLQASFPAAPHLGQDVYQGGIVPLRHLAARLPAGPAPARPAACRTAAHRRRHRCAICGAQTNHSAAHGARAGDLNPPGSPPPSSLDEACSLQQARRSAPRWCLACKRPLNRSFFFNRSFLLSFSAQRPHGDCIPERAALSLSASPRRASPQPQTTVPPSAYNDCPSQRRSPSSSPGAPPSRRTAPGGAARLRNGCGGCGPGRSQPCRRATASKAAAIWDRLPVLAAGDAGGWSDAGVGEQLWRGPPAKSEAARAIPAADSASGVAAKL
jgi:hypothetical protein